MGGASNRWEVPALLKRDVLVLELADRRRAPALAPLRPYVALGYAPDERTPYLARPEDVCRLIASGELTVEDVRYTPWLLLVHTGGENLCLWAYLEITEESARRLCGDFDADADPAHEGAEEEPVVKYEWVPVND
jgi:hypothetical protein